MLKTAKQHSNACKRSDDNNLIIDISNVHDVQDIILKVVLQDSSENVKRNVRSETESFQCISK